MARKFEAVRIVALLAAVGGASVLVASGSSPAKAAEERLYSDSLSTVHGLIAPSFASRSLWKPLSDGGHRTASQGFANTSVGWKGKSGPELEDPPMPTYNGSGQSSSSSNVRR